MSSSERYVVGTQGKRPRWRRVIRHVKAPLCAAEKWCRKHDRIRRYAAGTILAQHGVGTHPPIG